LAPAKDGGAPPESDDMDGGARRRPLTAGWVAGVHDAAAKQGHREGCLHTTCQSKAYMTKRDDPLRDLRTLERAIANIFG
jgi:hypothetical protein